MEDCLEEFDVSGDVMWRGLFPGRPARVHGRGDEDAVLFEGAVEDCPVLVDVAGRPESGVYLPVEDGAGEIKDLGLEINGDCVVVVEGVPWPAVIVPFLLWRILAGRRANRRRIELFKLAALQGRQVLLGQVVLPNRP